MNLTYWLILGCALGYFQTISQARTVSSLGEETLLRSVVRMLAGATLRLLLAGILLFMALKDGLLSGLLAFSGIFIMRWVVLIRQNRS